MRKLRRYMSVMAAGVAVIGTFLASPGTAGAAPVEVDRTTGASVFAATTIRSDLNGRCLDIRGFDPGNRAVVQMFDCHGSANQRWFWEGPLIRSELNGRCLDIQDFNPANDVPVQMFDCHGSANQRWRLA